MMRPVAGNERRVSVTDDPRLIRPEATSETDEVEWRRSLVDVPFSEPQVDRLLVVAPHPDDETLGAGGLLNLTCRAGSHVTIVVCSDGEAAYPATGALGSIRRHELRLALEALGPAADVAVDLVGMPDGHLGEHVGEIAALLGRLTRPGDLVVGPWPGDGHPDHAAVGRACSDAVGGLDARLWWYPVWAWHWAKPEQLPLMSAVRVRLDPEARAAKRRALDLYRSQRDGHLGEPIVTKALLSHFDRPFETFMAAT